MMRRNAAVARMMIPALADDPDTISESGSSTSSYSVSQPQVRAGGGAPPPLVVIPAPPPSEEEEEEEEEEKEEEEEEEEGGTATSAAASGAAINRYLRTNGLIPMTPPPPADDSQPLPPLERPLICAYCNCAFCFGAHEARRLDPPGLAAVYPAPPAPITLDLLTPPPVAPLYRHPREVAPAPLLVCSSERHFADTMGMLQRRRGGGAPPLAWTCTYGCLRVLPVVVGSAGARSPDLRADPAPPPEPWEYAGAYWNYVKPGHEDMVKLRLYHDPLELTLGRG